MSERTESAEKVNLLLSSHHVQVEDYAYNPNQTQRLPTEETNHINFRKEAHSGSLSTHKLQSVGLFVILEEFVDIPIVHPLGYHRVFPPLQIHTE